MSTSGAYYGVAYNFTYAIPQGADPTSFYVGTFATGEVKVSKRTGSGAISTANIASSPTAGSTGLMNISLSATEMQADEVTVEFIPVSNDFAARAVSIVTSNLPTPADILEVNSSSVSGVADFRATGFSTFDPAADTVANVTTVGSVTAPVTTDSASRTASQADVSALATSAALATAQADLDTLTGTDGVTLATSQPNYAPNTTTPPTAAAVADAVWDESYSAHTTAGTFGKLMDIIRKANLSIDGTVSGTPTVNTFDTNLTDPTGAHDHQLLLFVSGSLTGYSMPIETYVQSNGQIVLQEDLPSAPSASDEFVILPDHIHPVSEIQSGLATSAALAVVDANVDQILLDTGTDGVVLSSATLQSIATTLLDLSAGVESNRTLRQALRLILSASVGKLSGAATTTVTIRDSNDSVDRITATVDGDGNRTSVSLDAS